MDSNSYVCLPIHSCSNQKQIHSYIVQFIRTSSSNFFLNPNSFVCLPLPSYVFRKKIFLNSKSFVCRPSLSYVFHLLRMSSSKIFLNSNSFVCRPSLSYVFQKQIPNPNSFVCLPIPSELPGPFGSKFLPFEGLWTGK